MCDWIEKNNQWKINVDPKNVCFFHIFSRISCHTRSELDVSCSFLRHQTWRDTASGVDPELPRYGPYLCDKKQESHWDRKHNSFNENCYYVVFQNNNVQKQNCLDH